MTRARDELVLVGAAPSRSKDAPSFTGWLADGPRGHDETPAWLEAAAGDTPAPAGVSDPADTPRSWEPCGWTPLLNIISPSHAGDPPPLPAGQGPDHEPDSRLAAPETTDGAGEDPQRDDDARETARSHGTEVHAWLQRAAERGIMPAGAGAAWEEACAVFEHPTHDWIFRPADGDALCEAPLIARRRRNAAGTETRILGTVDRLLLTDDECVVIDYKSNRVTDAQLDAVVDHYRPQMEMYGEALAAARPDRRVKLVLLFTALAGEQGPGRIVTLA